jgi:hypothetical protein
VLAVALAAVGLSPDGDAVAGKPGGGGGLPPPTGTIFFVDGSYDGSTDGWGSMDPTGANRTVLPRMFGDARASRRLHGGRRWFLASEVVAGEPGFGGSSVRRDVFAVRDDGALRVRLTADPTLQCWGPQWGPDEDASGATVSLFARRWTGTTASDSVVAGSWGLHVAHLSFDGAGDVVGLDGTPAYLVSLGTHGTLPDAWTHAWSSDMTKVVVQSRAAATIRVVEVATGAVTPLGPGQEPDWSPDGSRIAYVRLLEGSRPSWALQTVNPNGSGLATVLSVRQRVSAGTSQHVNFPRWSPDGGYLAYQYTFEDNGFRWTRYVYRVAANGTGITNLTPEVAPGPGGGFFGLVSKDWR